MRSIRIDSNNFIGSCTICISLILKVLKNLIILKFQSKVKIMYNHSLYSNKDTILDFLFLFKLALSNIYYYITCDN